MVARIAGPPVVRLVIAAVVLSAKARQDSEQCLLQMGRSKAHGQAEEYMVQEEGKSLSWTTNIGQKNHNCSGSKFKVDFTGSHGGLAVSKGMILKKGKCPYTATATKTTAPFFTQKLSCEAKETGCHMWCAPVWQSHFDTTDWSAFDRRCTGWDGASNASDLACAKTGRLFTWARTDTPSPKLKNKLSLTFAVLEECDQWCAPLWVTIYDPKNWAKNFRWCFNRKDDWGVCDKTEDVSLGKWHDREFEFNQFMQKHGYIAESYVLEFAVYAEFKAVEVMINTIKLSHVDYKPATEPPKSEDSKPVIKSCGAADHCGSNQQCCRKAGSVDEAKCCPKSWSCCEDSCCPSYYNCTITDAGHTCKPPIVKAPEKPALCQM